MAFAIMGGFAFAIAFAIAYALAGAWAFFIALILVAVIALTMAKDFAFFLMLFFVILPVLNAVVDWLSWAVTRFNVSLIDVASPSLGGFAFVLTILLIDIAAAIIFVVSLTVLLPIGLELVDTFLSVFGRDSFDWRIAAAQAVASPWDEGLFVTGMLLTPLVPTLVALTTGFVSLAAPLTPGARAVMDSSPGEEEEGEEETGPDDDQIRAASRTVYLSRLWYAPALLISIGVFLGIWWGLAASDLPIADFLYNLSLCATVWGHGECAWL
jgi:hypothetical protein